MAALPEPDVLPEPELGALSERLAATRLVTLTGPGGVGKSRLAGRVSDAAPRTGAPVHRVDLSGCPDAALVPYLVATALHTAPAPGTDPVRAVLDLLADSRGLLLLDTCEHVLTGCAYLVGRLHDSCPELRILTTSRRPLGVPGEDLVEVAPLSREQTAGLLREHAASYGVELPDCWAGRLAGQLDGDPLSTLLAARSLRQMPAKELYEVLRSPGGRFAVLTDGPGDPARHRTLLETVEWSHELCSRAERLLWARLSAFTGPFTAEQVRTVFPDGSSLASLVSSSVVLAQRGGTYRLPLAHREYGQLRLAGLGDSLG
ncbi:ATP-binding protein [Streptomyces sp. NPDC059398]|uniref:ATP-binding protein n=1 Tax=Streptomyces sp. NPDC059398 TaxID=3346820 RepID=UPI0036AD9607